ncbi:M20 family metallopeptidase [Aureimonas fodinaquatilis]|uniref:M20 family metallopeptidase n=1 Tax=Aureimonas fodinaquatilis TaxID=2565783 RepID=A0A5B0DUK5_9HYPH|nr:M20 family metallopeptidase [Aureimonas fodinaquatilis]KAA0969625.1 M20 family metallopeptidase [Aureimonas fodinaquatilis]
MFSPDKNESGSALPEAVARHLDADELLRLTSDILAIESHRNAPGHETPVATHIRDVLRSEGIDAELKDVCDGRCNVIAVLPGTGSGPTLMFNGHIDTVPPGDMPRAFEPHIVGGNLFARGACDMKAGVAAQYYAMIALKRAGVPLAGDLIFTGVVGEEDGTSEGSLDVIANGPKADMVVVAEPSDLDVIVAHKGFDYYRIEVEGVPTHSSRPTNGVSAIYKAANIITAIEERLIPRTNERLHQLLGAASVNVSAVIGYARNEMVTAVRRAPGDKPAGAVVPDICTIYMDRRRIPGETLAEIEAGFEALLNELRAADPSLDAKLFFTPGSEDLYSHPPLDTDPSHPLVTECLRLAAQEVGIPPVPKGVPYWSDAALFNAMQGTPAIVFGPGHIGVAHSNSEFVPVHELIKAARVNAGLALSLLS